MATRILPLDDAAEAERRQALRERALQARIEELEETVRQLREQLAPSIDWAFLGFIGRAAQVLSVLYARAPHVVSTARFRAAICLGTADDDFCDDDLRDAMKRVRRALKPLGVEVANVYGAGYRLDLDGKAKLDAAIAAHAAGVPVRTHR